MREFSAACIVRFPTFLIPKIYSLSFPKEHPETANKYGRIFSDFTEKNNIISDKLQTLIINISIYHSLHIFCLMCSI